MSIQTIYANVSCTDLAVSEVWYEKLLGKSLTRRPMEGLLEWQFSDSAEMQLFEAPDHAGHSTLSVGVESLEDELKRLNFQGMNSP